MLGLPQPKICQKRKQATCGCSVYFNTTEVCLLGKESMNLNKQHAPRTRVSIVSHKIIEHKHMQRKIVVGPIEKKIKKKRQLASNTKMGKSKVFYNSKFARSEINQINRV